LEFLFCEASNSGLQCPKYSHESASTWTLPEAYKGENGILKERLELITLKQLKLGIQQLHYQL